VSGYDRDQDDQDNGDGENNVILLHGLGQSEFYDTEVRKYTKKYTPFQVFLSPFSGFNILQIDGPSDE